MLRKRQEITSAVKQKLIGSERNYPRIPWKPVSASSTAVGLYQQTLDSTSALDDASQRQTTALSVLYASPYVDGNGFYLYTEEELEKKTSCNATGEDGYDQELESEFESESSFISDFANEFSDANTPVEIVIVSFWYYWKEVLVISITTAFLCNIMITRTYLRWKIKGLSKLPENSKSVGSLKETDSGVDMSLEKFSGALEQSSVQDYISRYLTDFDPVACLGKGGFGVVFEAKNKIDDCHYAIKRILLPNKQESRDRVMREVKALAKLDHHHIVRYFNAWTECPPPGWQEKYDKFWADVNSEMFTSNDVTSTRPTTILSETNARSSVFLNITSSSSSHPPVNRFENTRNELNLSDNDISDSYIVFDDGSRSIEPDKSKGKQESIVIFKSDEESKGTTDLKLLTKSDRPKSLVLDQKAISESKNLNKVYLYIQMQLCQRQSLRDWLTNNKERDYGNVLGIFEQILQAVEHVHLHGLIHRDLKPSNIFFSLDNQIKVGDFGLVTAMTEGDMSQMTPTETPSMDVQTERHTAQVGTHLYMSQEQLLGKPYSYKVDIYSLGLILFELLVSFSTQMERIRVLQDIKNDKFPKVFQDKYKKEHELLRLMLSHSPDERPTTYGVRARLPLKQEPIEDGWHFELPKCRRDSTRTYHANTSTSSEGST